MKRSSIKKRLGRKRRTSHSIPMLPSRLQDGSLLTRTYHTAVPIMESPPGSPTDLRALARGRPCMVRGPFCKGQHESVCLAHFRLLPFCGMGMKPPHWLGAWCCSGCAFLTAEGAPVHERLDFAEGVFRTLAKLIEEGHVKVGT